MYEISRPYKKQIEEFRTLPKYKNYSVTINENPSK